MAKKQALGRGLSALIGEMEQAYEQNLGDDSQLVVEIDIDLIHPNPVQPRKKFDETSIAELAESIKEYGILQPILVYEENNEFYLIAGERRLRASKVAKLSAIKAIVVDIKPEKLREMALIENIQREDLNPIDLALSYSALIKDYDITQDELAQKVQKSRPQITNTLALLKLPKGAQDLLISGKITQGHAKILVNLNEKDLKIALDSIVGQKLSVSESEKLVQKIKENRADSALNNRKQIAKKPKKELDSAMNALISVFQKLEIIAKIRGDSLVLNFKNDEKIHHLVKILEKNGKFK
ncbi:ParB/RepB/Spo0J family partition protein [Helicobacter sp. 23-1045]